MARQNYSAEQWRTVGGLPYYAAAFVVSSAPHHVLGTVRDMLTAASDFTSHADAARTNPLIADAIADSTGPNGDPGPTKHSPENITRLSGLIEQGAKLIDTTDPQDAPAYKALVYRTAEAAAQASKDGLLGTSGPSVNSDEATALAELRRLLSI